MRSVIQEQDIVVVGGGITGAALAYGLAEKGQRVCLLDAPTQANKATRTNVGLIWCQSKFLHLPDYAKWGFMSARLFPALVQELEAVSGVNIPVLFEGGLIPVTTEEDYAKRGSYIEQLRTALGEYKGSMIDRGELEKKLPKIAFGPKVCGAAWCEKDGLIDPLALWHAFRVALQNKHVQIFNNTLAYEITPEQDGKGGYTITTSQGAIRCARLVLAAGLGNLRLARFATPTIPVFADQGQILLIERMPFVMPIPLLGMTQTFGGTTIIGFKHEKAGHRTHVNLSAMLPEAVAALEVLPELANKHIIRTWTGLRIMPDDGIAIYSQLPDHPNAFLINTHSAITMAAVHARLLPDFITKGTLPAVAQGMTLKRFASNY